MTAESDALSYWPVTIVPERKRSHMATAHYGFILKLSHHEWQKQKNNSSDTQCFVQRKWFLLFLPRMMFSVAKQGVMMAEYVAVSLLTGTKP